MTDRGLIKAIPSNTHDRLTIGVLSGWKAYSGTINSFLNYVYRGIRSAAQENNINLMIACGTQSPLSTNIWSSAMPVISDGIDFLPVGPWNTDGLIIAAPVLNPTATAYIQDLIREGFPIVFAGDHETSPAVMVDNEGGILQAFDHLVKHGHRRIAFIAGHTAHEGDTTSRINGYRKGLEKNGFAYDPDLVAFGEHNPDASYQAMLKILSRRKSFSAVIASNDESAVGAMDALRSMGLSVPQDVAVIGFDDRVEARAQIPLLTTVHHPMFELGARSVELLCQMIRHEASPDTIIRIPTHLIIRESCGCLPGAGLHRPQTDQAQSLSIPAGGKNPENNPAGPAAQTDRRLPLIQRMTEAVYKEMQEINRSEIEYLCTRLLDTFNQSLEQANPNIFLQAIQQILEHTAAIGDDLFAWQGAVSVLKADAPNLLAFVPVNLLDTMLHQARIAISEVSRGQYSRLLVHQGSTLQKISQLTAHFFSAKTESEIFTVLSQNQAQFGISACVVAFYEPEEKPLSGDARPQALPHALPCPPYTWSQIKLPLQEDPAQGRFRTRQFPPAGLFPTDQPFNLVLMPLIGAEGALGFTAIAAENLDPLGSIISQLIASLHNVRLYQDAVQARHMAEEANYLKSRFLSIVSHELRTPLNLIYGLSNMMLEKGVPLNEQEYVVNRKDLERIDIGAKHLESLIRDVLDLARSDLGQLKLVFETLDLSDVLNTISAIGEQLAAGKMLGWQVDIDPDLPLVTGDRTRLRQIILNLVNNAVKFTEKGFIQLSAHKDQGMVVISVRDTGLGIPLDEQSVIFDEFRQSRRTTARRFGGMGLGLAICKRLVDMHGGQIGVTSSGEVGAGSTFYIQLPAAIPPEEAALKPEDDLQAQRVLLLVKDLASAEKLSQHLMTQGFQVDVRLVEERCQWTRWLQPDPPDKLILDVELASEDGWDIVKNMKENPATANIPVLFYQLEEGADFGSLLDLNLLTKPLNTSDLANELLSRGIVPGENHAARHRPILVVDDDRDILELHGRILETLAAGYAIIQSCNGREALELIRKERPALVLLDLMMPEMDGFTVLENMQEDEATRNIPVIVLTSQVLTEEDMARLNSGVAAVLSKGMFSAQETLSHITSALSRQRRHSDTQQLVMKAIAYLHTHYQDPITRSDVAAYVGVSERHLARCFQQEVGLTPMTYLNRFRVNMAKSLLTHGQMSITEVAFDVGFSSGGYFTRVFKDEIGVSPRDYTQAGKN